MCLSQFVTADVVVWTSKLTKYNMLLWRLRHVKNGGVLSMNGVKALLWCFTLLQLLPVASQGTNSYSVWDSRLLGGVCLLACLLPRTVPLFVDSLWRIMRRRGGCTNASLSRCPYSNHWRWVRASHCIQLRLAPTLHLLLQWLFHSTVDGAPLLVKRAIQLIAS